MRKSYTDEHEHRSNAGSGMTNASRRDVIKGLALAAVAGGLGSTALGESTAPAVSAYPKLAPTIKDPVRAWGTGPAVETEYGRIRGYIRNGIYRASLLPLIHRARTASSLLRSQSRGRAFAAVFILATSVPSLRSQRIPATNIYGSSCGTKVSERKTVSA